MSSAWFSAIIFLLALTTDLPDFNAFLTNVKAAVASGATIIEKHIALRGEKKSLDYNFSLKDKEINQTKVNHQNNLTLLTTSYLQILLLEL